MSGFKVIYNLHMSGDMEVCSHLLVNLFIAYFVIHIKKSLEFLKKRDNEKKFLLIVVIKILRKIHMQAFHISAKTLELKFNHRVQVVLL